MDRATEKAVIRYQKQKACSRNCMRRSKYKKMPLDELKNNLQRKIEDIDLMKKIVRERSEELSSPHERVKVQQEALKQCISNKDPKKSLALLREYLRS